MSDRINAELLVELTDATEAFGEAYDLAKEAVETRDALKESFYAAADRDLKERRLPRRTIQVPVGNEVVDHVKTHHPGWRPVESHPGEDAIEVIIERDPAQMKYTFTNLETRMTYQRTVQDGNPSLDDERLRNEDPALWDRITQWDPTVAELAEKAMRWVTGDAYNDEDIITFLEEHAPRVLKPSAEWDKKDSAKVQKYMVPGKLMVKIVPPRKATDEEIEEALAVLEEIS